MALFSSAPSSFSPPPHLLDMPQHTPQYHHAPRKAAHTTLNLTPRISLFTQLVSHLTLHTTPPSINTTTSPHTTHYSPTSPHHITAPTRPTPHAPHSKGTTNHTHHTTHELYQTTASPPHRKPHTASPRHRTPHTAHRHTAQRHTTHHTLQHTTTTPHHHLNTPPPNHHTTTSAQLPQHHSTRFARASAWMGSVEGRGVCSQQQKVCVLTPQAARGDRRVSERFHYGDPAAALSSPRDREEARPYHTYSF